jgi:hypothetical protein
MAAALKVVVGGRMAPRSARGRAKPQTVTIVAMAAALRDQANRVFAALPVELAKFRGEKYAGFRKDFVDDMVRSECDQDFGQLLAIRSSAFPLRAMCSYTGSEWETVDAVVEEIGKAIDWVIHGGRS